MRLPGVVHGHERFLLSVLESVSDQNVLTLLRELHLFFSRCVAVLLDSRWILAVFSASFGQSATCERHCEYDDSGACEKRFHEVFPGNFGLPSELMMEILKSKYGKSLKACTKLLKTE
jgi:hypothetical protein